MPIYEFDPEIRAGIEKLTAPVVIYQTIDKKTTALLVTDGFCNMLQLPRQQSIDLMNNDMYHYTHPDDLARVSNASNRFASGDTSSYDVVYRSRNAKSPAYGVVHAHSENLFTSDGIRLFVTLYFDESRYAYADKKDELSKLDHRFVDRLKKRLTVLNGERTDYLTGLPSMHTFLDTAREKAVKLINENKQPAIFAFNLTGLKKFNDSYGLSGGDKLLKLFSELLQEDFGKENCARFGEDSFIALAPKERYTDMPEFFDKMSKLNNGVSLPVRVGICTVDSLDVSVNQVCDWARIACNSNRQSYNSYYVFFNQQMLDQANTHDYVINNFQKAINEGWIKIGYREIAHTINNKLCNLESTITWKDPQVGTLLASEIVPTLERAKLSYLLDLYAVDHVVKDISSVKRSGQNVVPVAIRISCADFETCDMVQEIKNRIDKAKIKTDQIVVEVSEDIAKMDKEKLQDLINNFHKAGIQVWMDNFGKSFSSLNVLKEYNFDLVKLDSSFMKKFKTNIKSRLIVQQLVHMLKVLGILSLAKGVENQEQADFLLRLGCNKIQGDYFRNLGYTRQTAVREIPEEVNYYQKIDDAVISAPMTPGQVVTNLISAIFEYNKDDDAYRIIRWGYYNGSIADVLIDQLRIGGQNYFRPKQSDMNKFRNLMDKVDENGWQAKRHTIDKDHVYNVYFKEVAYNSLTKERAIEAVVAFV